MFHAPCIRGGSVVPFPIAVRTIFLRAIVHSTSLVALVALASCMWHATFEQKSGAASLRSPLADAARDCVMADRWRWCLPKLIGGMDLVRRGCIRTTSTSAVRWRSCVSDSTDTPRLLKAAIPSHRGCAALKWPR